MDNILTNKYFTTALIIGLSVMIYLYVKQNYYSIEGMHIISPNPVQEIVHPWTNDPSGSNFGRVGSDKDADVFVIEKLQNKGYKVEKLAPEINLMGSTIPQTGRWTSFPQPMDPRPDLAQCQPCDCSSFIGSKK